MKIAVYQFNPIIGALEYNVNKIVEAIIQAKHNDCNLFVCPELCVTGYPPEDLLLRQDFNQKLTALIQPVFLINDITILLPLPTYQNNQIYNSVLVIQSGKTIAVYNKQELPNYGVFDDKRYFDCGDMAAVFNCNGIRTAVIICEDMWTNSPIAQAKNMGAEFICVVNASPFEENKHQERVNTAKQRVIEHNIPLLYVNCVGGQDELVYDGASFLLNHDANICYQATSFKETLDFINYPSQINNNNSLQLINHQYPLKEQAIYNALVLSVKDYVSKNKFKGVIIGLSGGVDSALVLTIAIDALGKDNVMAVMMPSIYTNDISIVDSREIIHRLGVSQYHELNIMDLFNQFNMSLSPLFKNTMVDTTEENLQARIRGTLLMALSNKFNCIVLTTGNKSELATGYATLYGDMAGGFAVLKDVLKTMVYKLCIWRNSMSYVIPERIITRPPSAELKEHQTDQDLLPKYDILDQIISELVDNNKSTAEIIGGGLNAEMVLKVANLIKINEYKRRQSAVGPKVTKRSFAKDWRYPISNGYNY